MKKILLVALTSMFFSSWSFTAPFSPTPLEISVPDEIMYSFNGNDLEFQVEISGKPARCWLIINTRLPEDQLPHQVQNGYLGWHYVNRIDTTVYVSGAYNFAPGSHTITWDGYGTENTSGGYGGTYEKLDLVFPGIYDYYIWGYDDKTPRENVCNFIAISFDWDPQYTRFGEWDETGLPRANPLIWGNVTHMYDNLHRARDFEGNWLDVPAEGETSFGPPMWTAFKFPLGSDPDDMAALQTSFMPGFSYDAQLNACPIVFDPWDQEYFYNFHVYTEQKRGALFKWHWIEDGNAEIVDGWGGWDKLAFETASRRGIGEYMPSVMNDNQYIYVSSPGRVPYEIQHDVLYIVDFDGNKVIEGQMLDDFYFPDNPNEISTNGMVNRAFASPDIPYQVILGGQQTCVTELVSCDRIINGEGDDEYVKWINQNGDYFQDSAWDPEISEFHWNCSTGAYRDQNGARRDEMFFDRIYMGDVVKDYISYGPATQHIHWIAFDSAHGVISCGPAAVKEEGQIAFSVDAAYPNPANPTTTIGFTLPEAGHVIVEIYNIAGQKVDTLVDDEMSAGKHSMVWDGSGFSAGVYFYTVKSGKFSKTMKVTLLK